MRSGGWKKSKKSINMDGGNVRGGWKKIKINKPVSTFSLVLKVILMGLSTKNLFDIM